MMRVLACPRNPSRMKLCLDSTAFTICGTTVSSKPTTPGKSGSRRCSLQTRFCRNSSFTERDWIRSSEKWLLLSSPRVWGNSGMGGENDLFAILTGSGWKHRQECLYYKSCVCLFQFDSVDGH